MPKGVRLKPEQIVAKLCKKLKKKLKERFRLIFQELSVFTR